LSTRRAPGFLADVVHSGETDHVRGQLSAGVVAAEFAVLIDPLQAQRRDGIGRVGRDLALEVHEVARALVEPFLQGARVEAEQRGELPVLRHGELDVARDRPDRLDRRRDGERVATAVDDPAARRRDLDEARGARVALALEELGLHGLQVQRSRGEQGERGRDRREHEPRAPDREPDQPLGRGAHREDGTSLTRRASGARMPSAEAAMRSTRWCSPQVLASSWSCPCSMSSSRARSCSRSSSDTSFLALC
jgi:hypothetical protein